MRLTLTRAIYSQDLVSIRADSQAMARDVADYLLMIPSHNMIKSVTPTATVTPTPEVMTLTDQYQLSSGPSSLCEGQSSA